MTSSVLLGLADTEILEGTPTTWETNKIGGIPDWMRESVSGTSCCAKCGSALSLVVQIYCPIAASVYHRTLYIFACLQKACWENSQCWKVYRTQMLDPALISTDQPDPCNSSKNHTAHSTDSWGISADDWGQDSIATDELVDLVTNKPKSLHADSPKTPFETEGNSLESNPGMHEMEDTSHKFQTLGLQDVTQDQQSNDCTPEDLSMDSQSGDCTPEDSTLDPRDSALYSMLVGDINTPGKSDDYNTCLTNSTTVARSTRNVLIGRYISVVAECDLRLHSHLEHEKMLLTEYQKSTGVNVDDLLIGYEHAKGSEKYEKTTARHGNQTFHKTIKRLALCPGQVLRYDYKGDELYLDSVARPTRSRCHSCGGQRVFELQLLPTLVNFLRLDGENDPALEFGTVHVYTCENNCWEESSLYRGEDISIYPDPDRVLFSKNQ